MIKLREARYCNLKLLLIFLVIYGHLIEPQIYQNNLLMVQYRCIYLVHMPLFSFLSGLFLNDCRSCAAQLKQVLPIYFICQMMAILFGKGTVTFLTPCWHLWYIVSYSCWIGIAWLWFRYAKEKGKLLLFICSLIAGCLAGYAGFIGRKYSLSRTIVFFPYFWLGIVGNRTFQWKKYRVAGIITLLISVLILYFAEDELKVSFLYQAGPFEITENGAMQRLLCYLLGILSGFFLLSWIPDKRYCFTKAGANTMSAYILHAPVVLIFRKLKWSGLRYMIVSIIFLWLIYKVFQWHGTMYGIVVSERRDTRWLPFRKCIKRMEEKYTVFCYPYPEVRR